MNKFFHSDAMIYRAEINRPPYPVDSFHLAITSQFTFGNHPEERHKQFDITLSRDELTKLRDVIDVHLATFHPLEEVEGAPV